MYQLTPVGIQTICSCINPSDAEVTFDQCTSENAKNYENHLNQVMWVFVRMLSLIAIKLVPYVPGFQSFPSILSSFHVDKGLLSYET